MGAFLSTSLMAPNYDLKWSLRLRNSQSCWLSSYDDRSVHHSKTCTLLAAPFLSVTCEFLQHHNYHTLVWQITTEWPDIFCPLYGMLFWTLWRGIRSLKITTPGSNSAKDPLFELRVWWRPAHHWQDYCCWSLFSWNLSYLTKILVTSACILYIYTQQFLLWSDQSFITYGCVNIYSLFVVSDCTWLSWSLTLISLWAVALDTDRLLFRYSESVSLSLNTLRKGIERPTNTHTHTHAQRRPFVLDKMLWRVGLIHQIHHSACAQNKYTLNTSAAIWHWTQTEAKSHQQLIFTEVSGS